VASDTVVREMTLPDVLAAQEVLQRAFAEEQRHRTGRLAAPPFGASLARQRFQKDPQGAFVALRGGRVVGCAFSVRWGALGWLGPLAVAPEVQGLGIGKTLVEAVNARWRRARVRLWGLETDAGSGKNVHLYSTCGYLPISVALSYEAEAARGVLPRGYTVTRLGELSFAERDAALTHVRRIASEAVRGLDPGVEATAALELQVGDTVLASDRRGLVGFAVVHWTPLLRSSDVLAVPIGAVSRRGGTRGLAALLRGLRTLALERQQSKVWVRVAGRRVRAQEVLRREGFREDAAMLRMKRGPDEERGPQLLLDSWL
jgi:GNAT superfamily N-acetyltransferase